MLPELSVWKQTLSARRIAGPMLLFLALLAVLLVNLSPDERTLGSGIKAVYVHVSLTWSGMAGFSLAALLGVATLLGRTPFWDRWRQTVGWVALVYYGAGLASSAIASQVNWGAVFWAEPRMVTSLNVLAAALIVQTANLFFPWQWLRALLSILLPFFVVWANASTSLVLHPENAIGSSDATAIQLTFAGMFLLVFLSELIVVWYWGERRGISG